MREIIIGTRGSKLAVIQTEWLLTKLKEVYPELKTRLIKITTRGDRYSTTALDKFAGQGIFVKELEKALIDGKIDLAVHSLKDLPTEIPDGLILGAITTRLDPRDVLVSRLGRIAELVPGSNIGTGSHRRAVQLHAIRPDIKVCNIRGNIDTRLQKVSNGAVDGIIIAAAAMIRLGWEDRITEYLPTDHFTPAVGQGALGLEIRSGDKEIASIASKINHKPTRQCIIAERAFLETLGGGCRAPIAALGTVSDGKLKLDGMVASADGTHILRASEEGSALTPEQTGKRLADKLTDMGAMQYIAR
ncbi:MAG: hydroxymethylbilane synthase [Chloroflexota bacterium]|nr:MAG: hydroxymethylbilane synthase [Chloroflexota bacterium]